MYDSVPIPDKVSYSVRARAIIDQLEAIAYAKALKIPLADARAEILQAALSREAKRRGRKARTRVDGDILVAWCE